LKDILTSYSFRCRGITELGLKDFSENLKQIVSLQDLKLNLSHCREIKEEGLPSLAEALKSLPSLRSLTLLLLE